MTSRSGRGPICCGRAVQAGAPACARDSMAALAEKGDVGSKRDSCTRGCATAVTVATATVDGGCRREIGAPANGSARDVR
jgi:hypothetical protein